MDNQHRQIKGYRELSQPEIDLMNRIKALGPEIDAVIKDVKWHLANQMTTMQGMPEGPAKNDEAARVSMAEPMRWAAEGKTDLQKGLMSLTRSIAQPTFF
jgi:hypothetical protein